MKIKTKRYYTYYILAIAGFCVAILPLRVGYWLANLMGKVAYAVLKKERGVAFQNLRDCFPEKTAAEREKLVRTVFTNLAKNGVELFNIYKLKKSNVDRWITVEGLEKTERALSRGKGFIMLACHFGNWELMSVYFSLIGYPSNIIARRVYFDRYDRFMQNLRASKGINVVYRDESPRKILKALRNNEALGIIADQDIDSIDGVFVDFFGRPAHTSTAPVALALATEAQIIPGFLVREKNNRHRLLIENPIEIEKKSTKEETLKFNTQKWSRVVESYIRKYPGQWVWMHKRWKTKPA